MGERRRWEKRTYVFFYLFPDGKISRSFWGVIRLINVAEFVTMKRF